MPSAFRHRRISDERRMPPLADAEIREKILEALSKSERGDGVLWDRLAAERLREFLPSMTQREANRMLRVWVEGNQGISQVVETREEYRHEHPFHYDFRIPIGGTRFYIEGRLIEDRRDDPEFYVANFKPVDSLT